MATSTAAPDTSNPNGPDPNAAGADDARLAALCDRLDTGIVVVSAGRRVRYANPAARALLALPDGVRGLPVISAISDYRLSLLVSTCFSRGTEVEKELADPAGDRHLVARAFPLAMESTPDPSDVALLVRDDTRLRRLETVRRDFVANVSHELRTPIAAIQLLVETLENGALAEVEVAAEFVNKIGLEVSHMAQMVSELLELSTIESPKRPLELRPAAARELLDAAERLRPLADERRLRIDYAVAPGTPDAVVDASRIEQVVRNLVHNAIKFTPPGGSIVLSAAQVPGSLPPTVELSVADTGCGIAPDQAARIFERFYKADKSRQRDGEGSGLGLAIARHTVEAHGGSIRLSSEPGRGSTFTVTLPAAAGRADG